MSILVALLGQSLLILSALSLRSELPANERSVPHLGTPRRRRGFYSTRPPTTLTCLSRTCVHHKAILLRGEGHCDPFLFKYVVTLERVCIEAKIPHIPDDYGLSITVPVLELLC